MEAPTPNRADPGTDPGGTRERLLDSAERLFAERTYQATSLRRITAEAGANLAAVHYHFGSKQELFLAVFRRRIGPLNDERLRSLGELERLHAPADPPLEALLAALFEPAVRLRATPGGASFAALMGRSLLAAGDHWKALQPDFAEVRDAFLPQLQRACPALSSAALVRRMQFAFGALGLVLTGPERLDDLSAGIGPPADPEDAVAELVRFTAAGLKAPEPCDPAPARPGARREENDR